MEQTFRPELPILMPIQYFPHLMKKYQSVTKLALCQVKVRVWLHLLSMDYTANCVALEAPMTNTFGFQTWTELCLQMFGYLTDINRQRDDLISDRIHFPLSGIEYVFVNRMK